LPRGEQHRHGAIAPLGPQPGVELQLQ
jgi:hypothetical protein